MSMMEEPKPEETKQVKEGMENYQSIHELENKFYNAGKAQGSKFSMEQRIKTSY
jgi:hypothetical protein|tara:strand:- start:85 stop:246 length:162 start_codon:yes stop_codon:yes gene_type:complete